MQTSWYITSQPQEKTHKEAKRAIEIQKNWKKKKINPHAAVLVLEVSSFNIRVQLRSAKATLGEN